MRMKGEKGFSLVETLVALALLGVISASFLSGVAQTSTARVTADERVSAKVLAETIMENVKKQTFYSTYNFTIPEEYEGYTATINATSERNDNIQKIIITIHHRSSDVLTLENYKVNR